MTTERTDPADPRDLTYNGRAITLDRCDPPLEDIATAVTDGRPVYVVLQPGDGTRYDLMVSPLPVSGTRGLAGWRPSEVVAMVAVTYLREDAEGAYRTALVRVDRDPATHQFAALHPNPWTGLLLTWFWAHVVDAVRAHWDEVTGEAVADHG